MTIDWDKLRLFYAVASAGSFTEAARRLQLSQPALSRQIIALEESLGAKLFHRHARGLALTNEGEQLRETAHRMANELERAKSDIEASRNRPTGEIKLTTTVAFGSTWLTRQMADFIQLYPDIRVSLVLGDEERDLSRHEADCAVRFHKPYQADLIQRPLAPIQYKLCASASYIAKYGEPQTPEDLVNHRLVAYGPEAPAYLRSINWALDVGHDGPSRVPVLTVNNSFGVLQAVEAGAGIAALPSYLIRFSEKVKLILPQLQGAVMQTYFVYPSELKGSVRVAALRDFLVERMKGSALNFGDGDA